MKKGGVKERETTIRRTVYVLINGQSGRGGNGEILICLFRLFRCQMTRLPGVYYL